MNRDMKLITEGRFDKSASEFGIQVLLGIKHWCNFKYVPDGEWDIKKHGNETSDYSAFHCTYRFLHACKCGAEAIETKRALI